MPPMFTGWGPVGVHAEGCWRGIAGIEGAKHAPCVKEFVVVEQGIGLELVLNLPLPETVCGELALDGMERLKGDEHTER